ncbi:MAG TPA: LysR family transcriptional regulator [Alphaproteobacteria bacterium]|nr:LysR family transcriptional regulator [Alphaproteobacteria bacterium]
MKVNWDDIQFFYAIAAHGGIIEAARKLRVNQTTVLRRIDHLEEKLGYSLFVRSRRQYLLTSQGKALFAYASKIAQEMQKIDFEMRSLQQMENGVSVTVSLPDFVYEYAVKEDVDDFMQKNPSIRLRFVVTNAFLNLAQQEADIIVRLTDNPASHVPEGLHGKCLGPLNLCGYQPVNKKSGTAIRWIGWGASVNFHDWLKSNAYPEGTVSLSLDNITLQLSQSKSSGHCIILPCWVGDGDEEMKRMHGVKPFKGFDAWILTHPSLKKAVYIKYVIDFLTRSLRQYCK